MRLWALVFAAVAASIFAVTALAGSGSISGGSALTYTAAAGEVNSVTVSVAGGNLLIDDPTGGVTGTASCTASGTQLNCGPVASLTSPMVINVGDGNDSVTIDASVNSTIPAITINGGTGNDNLTNNSNRSVTFIGGAGNDTLTGLGNHDTADYSSSAAPVTANLSAGTASGQGSDTLVNIGSLVGSSQSDTLTGDDRANTIQGGGGDDTIAGGPGLDDLQGGTGTNTLDYSGATSTTTNGVTVDLSLGAIVPGAGSDAGADLISGFQSVVGSPYNDTLSGAAGQNNTLAGGAGDDNLTGGNQVDTLSGNAGNDTFDGSSGSDTLTYADAPSGVTVLNGFAFDGYGGVDTIVTNSVENVTGSAFDDSLSGDANDNVLSGLGGNDSLAGFGGSDTLDGGTGSNTADYSFASASVNASLASGGASSDGDGGTDTYVNIQNLSGSFQADTLTGDDGPNTINGQGGADAIDGGPGNDVLRGQNGSGDTITGGTGNDAIDGGTGSDDTASYASSTSSAATDGVRVNLGAGTANAIGSNDAGNDTVAGLENAVGSPFADSLTGDPGENQLSGAGGNDSFAYSGGPDAFNGGTGTNSLDFSADPSGVALDLSNADAQQTGAENVVLVGNLGVSTIQNVTGSPQSDSLSGDAQQNSLSGGGGSDTINGGGDNDTVSGDAGNDVVTGSSGDDSVDGGDGNDTVSGRAGSDSLAGGNGTNTADYSAAAAAVNVNLRAGLASNDGDGGSDTLSGIQNVTAPSVAGNTLQGDAGNNVLDSGGAGGAALSFSGAAAGVTVDLGAGTASGDGIDTLLGGFATVTGSAFADALTATASGSTLNGLGGNDTLTGGPGSDSLNGGAGDDSLTGASSVNQLDGGNGIDTVDYSGATSVALVSLAAGVGIASWPAAGSDTLANLENVTGSPGADALVGDANDNVLRGLGGNDFLQGGAGDDSLQGAAGTDTADFQDATGGVDVELVSQSALGDGTDSLSSIENASGSAFADQLSGNGGPNTLQGSGGNDQIDGGGGADLLDGGANDDTIFARDGFVDTVVCGSGNDSASVEAIDIVNADCEIAGFLNGPVVQTLEATGVTTTAATLNGQVNPDGRALTYFFRYGITSGYGSTTASGPLPAGHTPLLVSAAISGLTPGTTYHYQLVVTDGLGNTTTGNDQAFTTGTPANPGPVALTLPAAPGDAPPHDATLLGRVTTNGVPTTYFFEYGTTTAYGQQTAAQQLGSTSIPVLVWDSLTGLKSKTIYHFRLVATNQFGTSFGADSSLTAPFKSTTLSITALRAAKSAAAAAVRPFGRR